MTRPWWSTRRTLIKAGVVGAFGLPLLLKTMRQAEAASAARRVLFVYFPDGVAGSSWHATGNGTEFTLGAEQMPLERHRGDCVFFRGLSLGPTESGSHPGGAKKLLTATDHGKSESIDQRLARTVGSGAPYRHVYLGAMANHNNASGDKHISYIAPETTVAPEDSPSRAFARLFGGPPPASSAAAGPSREQLLRRSLLDSMLEDIDAFRRRTGSAEREKLDFHLNAVRELETRLARTPSSEDPPANCTQPGVAAGQVADGAVHSPERFPEVLRLQMEIMVEAMACGLTKVGVLQASHHTSDLLMSRFPGTAMTNSNDMRSHQASHYGSNSDLRSAYVAQRRWFVEQFAVLLDLMKARPEGNGTMLDHSLVLLASEVFDGNDHGHDNMPFILAGKGGGTISPGRVLGFDYERHNRLFVSLARAMGEHLDRFGDGPDGALPGLLA